MNLKGNPMNNDKQIEALIKLADAVALCETNGMEVMSDEAYEQLMDERDAAVEVIQLLAIGHPDAPKLMREVLKKKKGENSDR